MFGDRGPNDIITINVLTAMTHQWSIPYDLFYGNHDHEPVCWAEDEKLRPGTDLRQQGSLTRKKKACLTPLSMNEGLYDAWDKYYLRGGSPWGSVLQNRLKINVLHLISPYKRDLDNTLCH